MSTQPFRLAVGGRVDRSRTLRFRFDGRPLEGHPGDTLASALLANGVRLVGRSFKYHRPRGLVAAGAEEPNALVQLGAGAHTEPNLRATQIALHNGLEAASQNCWPSVRLDLGAVNDFFSRLLPAGFYYKTFMWPASGWLTYERWIRRAAGLGRAPHAPDPDRYSHRHAHCDVLVVGAGPAGLAAALAAARAGARVIVADQESEPGGSLLGQRATIDDRPALEWVAASAAELRDAAAVTLLARTQAAAYWDANTVTLVEQVGDGAPLAPHLPRQRLWKVRAREVVLATGALERPIAFDDNDRPGVMLAGAARTYALRYAVAAGRRAVLFTTNDEGYAAALDLQAAGVAVAAIADARAEPRGPLPARARASGIDVLAAHGVTAALGRRAVRGARLALLDAEGRSVGAARTIDCDLLLVSGGWNPAVHLWSQARGTLRYDDARAAFLPDRAGAGAALRVAGAANGGCSLAACLAEGLAAGAGAAHDAGHGTGRVPPVPRCDEPDTEPPRALWRVGGSTPGGAKRFVDFQNDVTVADVELAAREGYRSVEHLKRYTTLGMGTDQGKLSNIGGLALLAETLGVPIRDVGTTTFRPPYTPVTFGAVAGAEVGEHLDPVRRTALHDWHAAHGAVFVNAGLWRRPQCYPRAGETDLDAVNREVLAVRRGVGLVDVSTLGKIDLQGRDAPELLARVYLNNMRTLGVGRCRYGVMLREDGMVFDDGTVTRLADRRYLITTTTAHAVRVLSQLEYWLQVEWRDLDVYLTSVTEHWAAMALAGPSSRAVLSALADGPVDDAALPFMAYRACRIAGVPARVFRISFSGELSFEINVPADHGHAVWEALMQAGAAHGIVAYGTEAMGVLRIEKGHFVVGPEADGRTTPVDLGLERLIRRDGDFIGRRSLAKPGLAAPDRRQLVGVRPVDPAAALPRGAMLVLDRRRAAPNPIEGHLTSSCFSPTLGRWIALALVARGRERLGERLWALSPLAGVSVEVEVVSPVFVDPEGVRLRV